MVTHNKELLMAFVYFDQSHCGYLLERDLEEILYTLGLHLSRAQVRASWHLVERSLCLFVSRGRVKKENRRALFVFQIKKLLNKPVVRESCYYRKLTDRGKDEPAPASNEAQIENLTGDLLENITAGLLSLPQPCFICLQRLDFTRVFSSISGNRSLLPSSKARVASEASESGNLIVYNGAMVDVASMMQKLEKSEKAREEIEQRLMAQDAKMGTTPMVVSPFDSILCPSSCRLHSVSVVRQDDDLAQFEICNRDAQLHF